MASDQNETSSVVHSERLRGGQTWSRVLRRGQRLRLTDLEGGAAVAALLFNADDPTERYNMPDTLKAQHIARLTRDFVLYSDMGRVLCSITQDSLGWHDTITGHLDAAGQHVADRERRARDRPLDAERTRRAPHEGGLAAAELAGHEHHVAPHEPLRQLGAGRLGLLG